MTKAEEVAWLDQAIADLGPDTYLGATLADQRDGIVSDIRSDIIPLNFTALRKEGLGHIARIDELQKERRGLEAEVARLRETESQLTYTLNVRREHIANLSLKAREAIEGLRGLVGR